MAKKEVEEKFYNPDKILSLKDLDGEEPSIYLITTNRSAGKTTAFLKKALEDFNTEGKKFCLIYRYSYELTSANEIFKDVLFLFNGLGSEMTTQAKARGLFYELLLDGKECGFALSLSNVDGLKKYSPLFANVYNLIFDEFQTESGKYLKKEVDKLQSLLLTVSRGGGEQSRNVKLFMLGNFVSLLNPYYIRFDIPKRVRENTHFLRGYGWVAEFGFNKSASDAIKNNAIYKAFNGDKYLQATTENVYLHDSEVFIEHMSGKSEYYATIVYDGRAYGIREFKEQGLLYISKKADKNYPFTLVFKADDHNANTLMLTGYSKVMKYLKDCYCRGLMRFDCMESKNAIFEVLSIDIYN